MWISVYVCSALLTAVGVLVAAEKLRTADSPDPRTREALAVLAGVLWPVLLAGPSSSARSGPSPAGL